MITLCPLTLLPFALRQQSKEIFFEKMKICPGRKTSLLMTAAGMRRFRRKTHRVVRGGSFINDERNLSPANRNNDTPANRDNSSQRL